MQVRHEFNSEEEMGWSEVTKSKNLPKGIDHMLSIGGVEADDDDIVNINKLS